MVVEALSAISIVVGCFSGTPVKQCETIDSQEGIQECVIFEDTYVYVKDKTIFYHYPTYNTPSGGEITECQSVSLSE